MDSSIDYFDPKIVEMVDLIKRIHPKPTLVDFYEEMSSQSVRSTLRLWTSEHQLVGFAYVMITTILGSKLTQVVRSWRTWKARSLNGACYV